MSGTHSNRTLTRGLNRWNYGVRGAVMMTALMNNGRQSACDSGMHGSLINSLRMAQQTSHKTGTPRLDCWVQQRPITGSAPMLCPAIIEYVAAWRTSTNPSITFCEYQNLNLMEDLRYLGVA
jgi:hypothetical protein